ncbi:hypothetical protein CROQUDRAFT_86609 [Cronartium quercuum f. sp. fusiforme G11]|uniref:Uncharacterized protein n=1 Tax=Cronartium quercuum f. sp. fusiforme G11 TaxID=708437 RepID=A0A9P6TGB1_9BASI|nr:hypothetical protein CROQUDRAFT_86609 [Cronartium quercuum f. sp. fusiforme G11]
MPTYIQIDEQGRGWAWQKRCRKARMGFLEGGTRSKIPASQRLHLASHKAEGIRERETLAHSKNLALHSRQEKSSGVDALGTSVELNSDLPPITDTHSTPPHALSSDASQHTSKGRHYLTQTNWYRFLRRRQSQPQGTIGSPVMLEFDPEEC